MHVPNLRFKEFTDEWQLKMLGDVCEFTQGIQIPFSEQINKYQKGFVRYLYIRDFFTNNFPCYVRNIYKEKIIKSNEIMMVNTGNTAGKAYMGVIGVLSNNAFKISFDHELIDHKFLFNTLTSESTQNKIKSFFNLSGQPHLGHKNIALVPFKFPSLPEQTKIANFLTAIDEKISQLTQKHDLLKQYKKGVMQQIFSQKLRFRDDDGREFPGWEDRKLKDIAQIVGGGTPETGTKEYWNGNIQWFTPTELKTKYATQSKRTITESGFKNSSAKILPVGTLLFSSRATVGDVSIALNPCTTNQGFQSLIVNNENNNEFIYYWILNNKKLFLEKASGSTFLEISKKEIEKLSIRRPSIKEQTKIANFLTAIDDKITQTQTQLEAVKQYKKGLLQQMFV